MTGFQAVGVSPKRSFSFGFDRFSGLYLAALFIAVFGIWKPNEFLTSGTVHTIASGQAISAMLGIAVLIPLAAGAYDLSVGATINVSTILVTWLQTNQHWGILPSIVVAILAGMIIGAVNGFLVVGLHVSSFIATLGMATVIGAVQTIVSGQSQPLPPTSSAWLKLTQTTVGGFQIVFLYLIILAIIVWWALDHTPAGRYVYAVGGNAEAARLSGVATGKWVFLSFVAAGTISGLAGVFYGSLYGPSLTFGGALLLPAYAAAFLGSTQLKPGRFNIWGTMIAIYVLAIGVQGFEYVTSAQWLNAMFNGVALIAAVAFAVWRQRKAAERRRASESGKAPESTAEATAAAGQATTGV